MLVLLLGVLVGGLGAPQPVAATEWYNVYFEYLGYPYPNGRILIDIRNCFDVPVTFRIQAANHTLLEVVWLNPGGEDGIELAAGEYTTFGYGTYPDNCYDWAGVWIYATVDVVEHYEFTQQVTIMECDAQVWPPNNWVCLLWVAYDSQGFSPFEDGYVKVTMRNCSGQSQLVRAVGFPQSGDVVRLEKNGEKYFWLTHDSQVEVRSPFSNTWTGATAYKNNPGTSDMRMCAVVQPENCGTPGYDPCPDCMVTCD